jgi:hypothetical protein
MMVGEQSGLLVGFTKCAATASLLGWVRCCIAAMRGILQMLWCCWNGVHPDYTVGHVDVVVLPATPFCHSV